MAIWMMRPGRRSANHPRRPVPIAVRTTPDGRHIFIRTPATSWQPLAPALLDPRLRLTEHDYEFTREDSIHFIRTAIDDAVSNHPDTLLLTHAQNLRRTWGEVPSAPRGRRTSTRANRDIRLPGRRHLRSRPDQRQGQRHRVHHMAAAYSDRPRSLVAGVGLTDDRESALLLVTANARQATDSTALETGAVADQQGLSPADHAMPPGQTARPNPASTPSEATVDEVDLAGDERGLVRGEERHEVGHVLGGLLSLQVLGLGVVLENLLGEFAQSRGSAGRRLGPGR